MCVWRPAGRGPRCRAFGSRRRPSTDRTPTPGVRRASLGPAPPRCPSLYLFPRAARCVGLCPCGRLLPSSRVRAGGSLMRPGAGTEGGARTAGRDPGGLRGGYCGVRMAWCVGSLGPQGLGRGQVRSGVRVQHPRGRPRSRCPRYPRPSPRHPAPPRTPADPAPPPAPAVRSPPRASSCACAPALPAPHPAHLETAPHPPLTRTPRPCPRPPTPTCRSPPFPRRPCAPADPVPGDLTCCPRSLGV